MSTPAGYVMVALGRKREASDADWVDSGLVREVVRFERAVPSGFRFGSRALGLGLDSLVVAAKVLVRAPRGPYLASNPWIAVALRLLGRRHVAVTGIYAETGSRSFRILRRILADAPIVTLVEHEAAAWRESGGRASSVLYGNTFDYPYLADKVDGRLSIFIGGSSDRDPDRIARLESELRTVDADIDLVVVSKEEPSQWVGSRIRITHTGYVSAAEFGRLISESDVVYLPLSLGRRAAGHMVAVGALEAGVPVVSSDSPAMLGYVDGECIRIEIDDHDLVPQLIQVAQWGRLNRPRLREEWASRYSHRAYVNRVANAIDELT